MKKIVLLIIIIFVVNGCVQVTNEVNPETKPSEKIVIEVVQNQEEEKVNILEESPFLTIKNNKIEFQDVFLFEGQESFDKQKSRNKFLLTNAEFNNIERADLWFVPYCNTVRGLGVLDIEVNNINVFSAIPVCKETYRQPVPVGVLDVGENYIVFESSKGDYSIVQIKLEFENKGVN